MWLIWGRHGLLLAERSEPPGGSSINYQLIPTLCNVYVKQQRGRIQYLGKQRTWPFVMARSHPETTAKDKTRGRDT